MASPDAKELDGLRNHLEHKYAQVVDPFRWIAASSKLHADHLAHVIERDDLTAKTRLIVTLARSTLIYLCLAMHYQEQQDEDMRDDGITMPFIFDDFPDDLKI